MQERLAHGPPAGEQPETDRGAGPVEPAEGAPVGWGQALAEHRGVPAYSNGGNTGYYQTSTYGYAWQCVEYARRFAAQIHGTTLPRGDAKTNIGRPVGGMNWVPNEGGPTVPGDGDILVFSGGEYGHIAVATEGGPGGVGLVHQNWSASSGSAKLAVSGAEGDYKVGGLGGYALAGWHTTGAPPARALGRTSRRGFVEALAGSLGLTSGEAAWDAAVANQWIRQGEPDAPITRGAAATFLSRALSLPAPSEGIADPSVVIPWSDVVEGDYFAEPAALCRLYGIFAGGATNRFRGNDALADDEVDILLDRMPNSCPPPALTRAQQASLAGIKLVVSGSTVDVDGGGEVAVDELDNQTYAHGGYMGAAASFLGDALWMGILRDCDPVLYTKLAQQGAGALNDYVPGDMRLSKLDDAMQALENHPVLAAYGVCRNEGIAYGSGDAPTPGDATPLEWDVWIDPDAAGSLDAARIYHGSWTELKAAKGELAEVLDGKRSPTAATLPEGAAKAATGAEWVRRFERAMATFRFGGVLPPAAVEGAPMLAGLGLYLDIKSPSTSAHIDAFVRAVERDLEVEVLGVGAFSADQLADMRTGTDGLLFFHTVEAFLEQFNPEVCAELKRRADEAPREVGTDYGPLGAIQAASMNVSQFLDGLGRGDSALLERVAAVKNALPWLGLAGYVQECDIDESSVAFMVEYFNSAEVASVFDRGIAYGNANGIAESGFWSGDGDGGQSKAQQLDDAGESLSGLPSALFHATTGQGGVADDLEYGSEGADGWLPEDPERIDASERTTLLA